MTGIRIDAGDQSYRVKGLDGRLALLFKNSDASFYSFYVRSLLGVMLVYFYRTFPLLYTYPVVYLLF